MAYAIQSSQMRGLYIFECYQYEVLNMKPKNKTFKKKRLILITFLSIVSILMIFGFMIVFPLILEFNPYQPLTNYSEASVLEICLTLNIPPDSEFCEKPLEQDRDSFLQLLETNFPVQNSTYFDVIPLISKWNPSAWSCTQDINYNNCPPPEDCKNRSREMYLCVYDLSFTKASAQLNIFINRNTGRISQYEILEQGDS